MRKGWTSALKVVAIFAIAFHAILVGPPPTGAVAAADPFSVICHSGSEPDQAPDQGGAPSATCDHCTLCPAAGSATPAQPALIGLIAPARVLHRLTARPATGHAGAIDRTQQPRGPPQQA